MGISSLGHGWNYEAFLIRNSLNKFTAQLDCYIMNLDFINLQDAIVFQQIKEVFEDESEFFSQSNFTKLGKCLIKN